MGRLRIIKNIGFSQIVIAVGIALPDVLDKANRFFQHDNSHSRVVFISRLSMLEEFVSNRAD